MRIAALYVDVERGPYPALGLDCWGVSRDARLYDGTSPVIAHPPCKRWGRYWSGGPSASTPRLLGDDGGCFAHAWAAVRRCGGVLEHPEASHAWRVFGLRKPEWREGWVECETGGWACCVSQHWYGHASRKLTWLYAYGASPPPELDWRTPEPGTTARLDRTNGNGQFNGPRLRSADTHLTPFPFARKLIELVEAVCT